MKKILLFLLCLSAKILLAQTVILRTNVENLRLREQPNVESPIIKTVPIGTSFKWLNGRCKQKMTLDWKGQKVTDYWYKVSINLDSIAWVFGKGIELEYIAFGSYDLRDSIDYHIDNEWIAIKKTNKKIFKEIPIIQSKYVGTNSDYSSKGRPFKLNFENGKSKIFNEFVNEKIQYIGELVDVGYYIIEGGICCDVYSAVRKSDGKMEKFFNIPLFSNKNNPVFSSDKTTFVSNYGCEPGGQDGIAFYNINTQGITRLMRINVFPVRDFRFITNRSGIAKLRDDTYLKITIK